MSNEFCTLQTAVWKNADYRKLTIDAQWAYEMLLSQPDISSAGVITICIGRWAKYAPDMTEERLTEALKVLRERGYILVDWESFELMVRTYIRHDRRGNGPKYGKAVQVAVTQIQSPGLTDVARQEWAQRYDNAPPAAPKLRAIPMPDTYPDTYPDTHGHTDPIGASSSSSCSSSSVPALSPSVGAQKRAATMRGTRMPEGWEPGRGFQNWASQQKIPRSLIDEQLPRFRDWASSAPGQKGVKVDWEATFRNWIRRAHDERAATRQAVPKRAVEW